MLLNLLIAITLQKITYKRIKEFIQLYMFFNNTKELKLCLNKCFF